MMEIGMDSGNGGYNRRMAKRDRLCRRSIGDRYLTHSRVSHACSCTPPEMDLRTRVWLRVCVQMGIMYLSQLYGCCAWRWVCAPSQTVWASAGGVQLQGLVTSLPLL